MLCAIVPVTPQEQELVAQEEEEETVDEAGAAEVAVGVMADSHSVLRLENQLAVM